MHPIRFDLQLMRRDNDLRLTNRENEILQLLAKAMNRNEIATKLFISDETVKMHTKNLYKKLNAKNKIDALIKMKLI
ncbi:MAG TPA: helix-turn-helix transcriptional regulator [Chitinophagaceae bacterium]